MPGLQARNPIRNIYYDTYEIELTQGQVALVSGRDLEATAAIRWCAHRARRTFYAKTKIRQADGKWTTLMLHRLLRPELAQIDHHDGNGLNNTRSNLREATNSENGANSRKQLGTSSQFKGVSWERRNGKWRASIRSDYKRKHLGYFTSETEAAQAYNVAALKTFGAFAKVNGART
jgi:hypothetical protein